jgi:hypothetical protein
MSSFDYNVPGRTVSGEPAKGSRTKYRRFATAAEALRYAVEDLRIPKADNRILKRSCFRKSPSPQNAYSFVFFQLSSARLKHHRLLEPGVRRMAQLSR